MFSGQLCRSKILSPAMAYNTLAIGGYNDKETASKDDDTLLRIAMTMVTAA